MTFLHLTRSRVLGEFVELAGRHAFDFRLLARIHMRLHAVDLLHRATEDAGPFACRLTLLALTVGGHLGDEPWLQLVDGVESPRCPSCAKLTNAQTACSVVSCLEPLLAGLASVLLRNVLTALHMRSSYSLEYEGVKVVEFDTLSGLRR